MKNILEFLKESLVVESSNKLIDFLNNKVKDMEDFGVKLTASETHSNTISRVIEKIAKANGYEFIFLPLDEGYTTVKQILHHVEGSKYNPLFVFWCNRCKDVDLEIWDTITPIIIDHKFRGKGFYKMIAAITSHDFDGLPDEIKSKIKSIYKDDK